MTMNTLVNIPEKVYADVARRILESADDEHNGIMTFCLMDEEVEDKAGTVYLICASGQIYYTPTIEEWGHDFWVNGVSFNYATCELFDEYGKEVETDFDEGILRKYIC